MTKIYQVCTNSGICINIEAENQHEARLRASSPEIPQQLSLLVQQALSNISSIEPLRGPRHQIKNPVFYDEFFRKKKKQ